MTGELSSHLAKASKAVLRLRQRQVSFPDTRPMTGELSTHLLMTQMSFFRTCPMTGELSPHSGSMRSTVSLFFQKACADKENLHAFGELLEVRRAGAAWDGCGSSFSWGVIISDHINDFHPKRT